MSSTPERLLARHPGARLHDGAATRELEARHAPTLPPHALMERAGLALARLVRAVAPHARRVLIAAGPGNNGGDGLVAARLLRARGLDARVALCLPDPGRNPPADAAWARAEAITAGVPIEPGLPERFEADLVIDALFGLGQTRAPQGPVGAAVRALNAGGAPIVAADVATGLCTDTGRQLGPDAVNAAHTLSMLTLKPGLFTGDGRELSGEIWWDRLGLEIDEPAVAELASWSETLAMLTPRGHAGHKGRYGDVHVIGGAPGMVGALLLAGRAALAAGAGRCIVHPGDTHALAFDSLHPELMIGGPDALRSPADFARATVLAGCGGGPYIATRLPACLSNAARLLLDADGLNALAQDPALFAQLARRGPRGQATVLTPHPLEAARLLGCDADTVQADRLGAARELVERTGAVVVLKGSGTVIAAPGALPRINPTGDARLASAGCGDSLAGWLAGLWSARGTAAQERTPTDLARHAAQAAVFLHGQAGAETATDRLPLLASELPVAMERALAKAVDARAA